MLIWMLFYESRGMKKQFKNRYIPQGVQANIVVDFTEITYKSYDSYCEFSGV